MAANGTDIPEYEWVLCESPSFSEPFAPLVKIGSIENAQNQQWNPQWNRAGTCSFQIRTNNPMAYEIMDLVDLNDIRGTVRKCIKIRRNNKTMWSGPIWGIQGSLDAGTLDISCVGWIEKWQYEMYWASQAADYSNGGNGVPTDIILFGGLYEGTEYEGLISLVNAQNLAQTPETPLLIQPGTVTTIPGQTLPVRNRFYQMGTMLGPAIQELSDIEDGPDMNVDPVTRELNVTDSSLYTQRDNIVLGYNWGPNNLKDFQWEEDPTQMINNMYLSSLGAPVGPVTQPASQAVYGNWSQYVTLSGANQSVLIPYGVAQEVVLGLPLLTYTLIPHPRTNTDGPTLFDDFDIGDGILFTAQKDCVTVKQQGVRVFGAQITIDENGNETVTSIQITPPTAGTAYTPPS
jgi:hypothetical protein